jgi:CheY-like chemotaxis protein
MRMILLIDDDPDYVEATCTVLESVPYCVLVALSGSEGLVRARETRPDLIILDMIMPGEDGFQILEKLRADPTLAHVPVMVLTSLPNGLSPTGTGETNSGAADHVTDYVNKSIKPAELLQRVERLLGLRCGAQLVNPNRGKFIVTCSATASDGSM